jgi:hypothetical protein
MQVSRGWNRKQFVKSAPNLKALNSKNSQQEKCSNFDLGKQLVLKKIIYKSATTTKRKNPLSAILHYHCKSQKAIGGDDYCKNAF